MDISTTSTPAFAPAECNLWNRAIVYTELFKGNQARWTEWGIYVPDEGAEGSSVAVVSVPLSFSSGSKERGVDSGGVSASGLGSGWPLRKSSTFCGVESGAVVASVLEGVAGAGGASSAPVGSCKNENTGNE
jgi:hypothetical protein